MRTLARAIVALIVVLAPIDAHAFVIVASPSNEFVEYFATPMTITLEDGPVYLVNTDTVEHSIWSRAIRADDSAIWCAEFDEGQCPLFWSDEIVLGPTQVMGLEDTASGTQYPFVCGVHHTMTGTLIVL